MAERSMYGMKPRVLAISLLLVLFSMNLAQADTGDMFQVLDWTLARRLAPVNGQGREALERP